MKKPTLELYYFDACPYCQRVMQVIKKHNILVNWKNIHDDKKALDFLIATTGRKTVPCLFIDGKPMHESLDIMNWLESNLDVLAKA